MMSKYHHSVLYQSSLIPSSNLRIPVDKAASTDSVPRQVYYRKTVSVPQLEAVNLELELELHHYHMGYLQSSFPPLDILVLPLHL